MNGNLRELNWMNEWMNERNIVVYLCERQILHNQEKMCMKHEFFFIIMILSCLVTQPQSVGWTSIIYVYIIVKYLIIIFRDYVPLTTCFLIDVVVVRANFRLFKHHVSFFFVIWKWKFQSFLLSKLTFFMYVCVCVCC